MTQTAIPSGFTYSYFPTIDECYNFIWGYLYVLGLAYHKPTVEANGMIKLVYESK